MKIRDIIYISFVFLILLGFPSQLIQADITYDDEYKFIERTENWQMYDGKYNQSGISESTIIYNVLDYESDILTYEEIVTYVEVIETNLSYISFPYKARIGRTFVHPEKFQYYYDVWLEDGLFGFVYSGYPALGTILSGVKTASNLAFTYDVNSTFYDVVIDVVYNESNDTVTYIYGELNRTSSFYVEYAPNGVLLMHKVTKKSNSDTYQSEYIYTFSRVDEFELTEPLINATNLSLSVLIIAFISTVYILKRNRKNKI
ncbi:MAG: hypothetical protein ACTSVO_00155 [Candidatus Heimdallarchaeaceae archaeon]